MGWGLRKFTRVACALTTASVLVLCFQNCSFVSGGYRSTATSAQSSGGGGFDEKIYSSYGACPENQVGIATTIAIAHGKASILRQDCQDLTTAQPIDVTAIQIALDGNVMRYGSKVFDEQSSSKVTVRFCQTADQSTQVMIWKNSGTLSGVVVRADGKGTGTVAVTEAQPDRYASANGELNLRITGAQASLDYKINGTTTSLSGLSCAVQSFPDDGSSRAPSGLAQLPTLLNSYQFRPPWKVAGVDYFAGYPAGTVLKNPMTIAMAGVSLDTGNHIVNVTGNDVVLDGYDFSLNGGWLVLTTGSHPTIINSNFKIGANGKNPIIIDGPGGANISYNVIDGDNHSLAGQYAGLVNLFGSGTVTLDYNWMRNSQLNFILASEDQSQVITHNVFENNGTAGTGNWLQNYNAVFASVEIRFNTFINNQPNQKSQGLNFDPQTTAANLFDISYNTILLPNAVTPTSEMNFAIRFDRSQLNGYAAVRDNFVDATGISVYWLSIDEGSGPFNGVVDKSNNRNLNGGAL